MSKWEIIEYKLDSDGKEVVSAAYEVDSSELTRVFENLDKAVKSGAISSYAYTPV